MIRMRRRNTVCPPIFIAALVSAVVVIVLVAGCGGHTSLAEKYDRSEGMTVAPAGVDDEAGTLEAGSEDLADEAESANDAVEVRIGTWRFPRASNRVNHEYLVVRYNDPWDFVGYGLMVGRQAEIKFRWGGVIQGVNTTRMITELPLPPPAGTFKAILWIAQDRRGNVHILQSRVADDGHGGSSPAVPVGIAAGGNPSFLLARAADLVVGAQWYDWVGGLRVVRRKILRDDATARGKSGLLLVQTVEDTNHDGRFDPKWTSPDLRQDLFWEPSGGGIWNITVARIGGAVGAFVRQ